MSSLNFQNSRNLFQGCNLISCEHCKDYRSTFEYLSTKHWPMCECYPVECPNECGEVLQRQNLNSHVDEHCPLTIVQCDFQYVGCEVELPRQDMREHNMFKLQKHLSMMAECHREQMLFNSEKSQQMIASQLQQDQDRERIENLVQENEALIQRVSELEKEQKKDRETISQLESKINMPPIDIVMKLGYIKFSKHFYTHERGYKLQLRCDASPTHVSVYFVMMQGEFDNELAWPFQGEVIIHLLSQDGSTRYHEGSITLNDRESYSQVIKGEQCGTAQGINDFISLYECNTGGYIRNDSLHFRIKSIEL